MKILYCAAEADPFIKTGGLADVAGTLPLEMKKQGHDVKVVIPLYKLINEEYRKNFEFEGSFYVDLDFKHHYVGVFKYIHRGVEFYFLDNEDYFNRDNVYGENDDCERFVFFSKACVQLLRYIDFDCDIIHSNDWHTAMVNVYARDFAKGDPFYESIKTVFTIHNLKYQGVFSSNSLRQTDLSPMYFSEDALKFYDAINFMKGAIVFSDKVTTVSKTYADEIKYSFFGEGLDGVIRQYHYKISGITNGIDTTIWNPEKDKYLFKNYSLKNIKDKSVNKKALQRMYGLEEKDVPIFAMVTRLVENKGLELVRYIMDEFLTTEDVQVIILGTGDYSYEEMFKYYEWKFPDKLKANIYYNNEESHKIYAGADFLMMPSIFEPCGISQLIAMRYGTIPVVRETGGLRDTVQSFNEFSKEGNGFSFTNINAHDFLYTLRRAISFYYNDDFKIIQENAMKSKNDWQKSAKEYIQLYEEIIK